MNRRLLLPLIICVFGCAPVQKPRTISRTEYTYRIENFFQFETLRAGKPSQFEIHLTDVSDNTAVENAEVTLTVKPSGGDEVVTRTTTSRGKEPGVYLASLTIPRTGVYTIEFRVKNARFDERLAVEHFEVE